jgi:hypothetical protein
MEELTEKNVDDRAKAVFTAMESSGKLYERIDKEYLKRIKLAINAKTEKEKNKLFNDAGFFDTEGDFKGYSDASSEKLIDMAMKKFYTLPLDERIRLVTELEGSASAPAGGRRKSRRRARKSKKMRRRRSRRTLKK